MKRRSAPLFMGLTAREGLYVFCARFSPDHITEEEARTALRTFVSENCCYGKAAVNTMTLDKIAASNAYHVRTVSSSPVLLLDSALEKYASC